MRAAWVLLLVVAVAVALLMFRRRVRNGRLGQPDARVFQVPSPDPNVFMVRGFDFYVRLEPGKKDEAIEVIRRAVGGAGTVYDEGSHAVVLWSDFRPPAPLLERLSRELQTEVIWLAFQKQVDAFGYERWRNGERLRRLTFGCFEKERTWEEVDGQPEPWEAAAIFNEHDLEMRLRSNNALNKEFRLTEDEERRLRAVWRDRRLEVDGTEPSISGRDIAEAVAVAHELPGWR